MATFTAAEIADITRGRLLAPGDTVVDGAVETDSRQVGPGSLYAALVGERVDGHDFAPAALAAGAVLVLSARPVAGPCVVVADVQRALGDLAREHLARRRRAGALTVVAITGSVGKTTTKDLIHALLARRGEVVAPPGSLNNELGLPMTALRVQRTTRYLVAEMGADKAGDLEYLTSIAPPDIAVVLAVGRAHLGGFGSLDDVARAKAELVTGMDAGGVAVLNADDFRVAAMAGLTPARPVWFAVQRPGQPAPQGATAWASDIELDALGHPSFVAHMADAAQQITSGLTGSHHVANLLAAACVGLEVGLSPQEIAAGLSGVGAASPHRMAVTRRPDGICVIDDTYNANPESMRAGIDAAVAMTGQDGRTVAVLGTMNELGDSSRAEHEGLGEYLGRAGVGCLVGVGEGGRQIIEGAARFAVPHRWVADGDSALAWLTEILRPGDTIVIKASHSVGLSTVADRLAQCTEE